MQYHEDMDVESVHVYGQGYMDIVWADDAWYLLQDADEPMKKLTTHEHTFATGKSVERIRIDDKHSIIYDDGIMQETNEWLNDRESDWHKYIPEQDFNEEFWQSPQKLYHGTKNLKRLGEISETGLECRNETRGLSNQSTGAAVFASQDEDFARMNYGDHVIEIDTQKMKEAGFVPKVDMETPLNDGMMIESIAHELEEFDYSYEGHSSDGLDHATVIIHEDIPAEYLTVEGIDIASYMSAPEMNAPNFDEDLNTSTAEHSVKRIDFSA